MRKKVGETFLGLPHVMTTTVMERRGSAAHGGGRGARAAVGARRCDEPGKAARLVVVIGFLSSTSRDDGTIHLSFHRGNLGFDSRRLGELMSSGKHGHGVAGCVIFP